jgi:hypothetical protein
MVGLATIQGCVPPQAQKAQGNPYVPPSFDFTPPSNAAPGSAEVTFAIVNAAYSENQPWTGVWPFNDVSRNMALDFQEIVSARGFSVRGPFASYDEITFPDKKGSDLVLQPALEIRLDIRNISYVKQSPVFVGLRLRDRFSMKGEAVIGGRVTLSLMESLSKERMWFKSIELPQRVISWEGEKQYYEAQSGADLSDPSISRPLGETMKEFYAKVMQASWNYLDPEEMKLVKKQSEEIRKKKVY